MAVGRAVSSPYRLMNVAISAETKNFRSGVPNDIPANNGLAVKLGAVILKFVSHT